MNASRVRRGAAAGLLAASILNFGVSQASAGQPACLSSASAALDLADLVAVEVTVADSCDCEDFDGTDGKETADYKRCFSGVIKAAVKGGTLRTKCKGRLL